MGTIYDCYMNYEVEFPKDVDVDYWDYQIVPTDTEGRNRIVVIFEIEARVMNKTVGYTSKSNEEWRTFNIRETGTGRDRKLIMEI